jgi:hypothetical protein
MPYLPKRFLFEFQRTSQQQGASPFRILARYSTPAPKSLAVGGSVVKAELEQSPLLWAVPAGGFMGACVNACFPSTDIKRSQVMIAGWPCLI